LVVCTGGIVVLLGAWIAAGHVVTGLVAPSRLGRWDEDLSRWLANHRTAGLDTATHVGSMLAETPSVLLISGIVVVLLAVRHHWAAIGLVVGALVVECSVFVVTSVAIDRPRPDVPHLDAAPPTSSFPSGHSAASLALAVSLAVVVWATWRSGAVRTLAATVAVLVPTVVAASRLYRGMHHASDVAFGLLLGAAALLVALLATRTARVVAELQTGAPAVGTGPPEVGPGEGRR
jgi:undecaprenyl-diphosphatase